MLRATICLLCLFASPAAHAGEAVPCWSYETASGLFDWTQRPSTACRDGNTVAGGVATAQAAEARPPAAAASKAAPGSVRVWFSGEARIGFAARF